MLKDINKGTLIGVVLNDDSLATMESCVDVRCFYNGPTPTYVDTGLLRITQDW